MKKPPDFSTTINSIPCGIVIIEYTHQPPLGPTADSDWDCYGYTEVSFEVLDRKGYPAKWLASQMSEAEEDKIKQLCIKHKEGEYANSND